MRKLSRYTAHRRALLRNLAIALIENKIIETTLPKAKTLRPFIEKLITKAKIYTLHNYRQILGVLYNNERATGELFNNIVKLESIQNRRGGYTRIIKNNYSRDGCTLAYIQILTEKNTENTQISKNTTNVNEV